MSIFAGTPEPARAVPSSLESQALLAAARAMPVARKVSLERLMVPSGAVQLFGSEVVVIGAVEVGGTLVIAGGLEATGAAAVVGASARLVVAGPMRAAHLFCAAPVELLGNLDVPGVIYASRSWLRVDGSLRARTILTPGRRLVARRGVVAGLHLDGLGRSSAEASRALQSLLVPSVLVPDGRHHRLEPRKLFEHLVAGGRVFR